MLSSPHIDWLDHRFLALTRLAQRLLTLQAGHSLISPKLTLPVCVQRTGRSVGSSISITLHAATQGGIWLFPPWDFPHQMRVTLWITTAFHLDTQIKFA